MAVSVSFGSLVVVVQFCGSQQVVLQPNPNPGLDVAQDHTFVLFVSATSEMDLKAMLLLSKKKEMK